MLCVFALYNGLKDLSDKGEQVCQMTLLLKDHKEWSEASGKPVPSRPVVSGNSGLNCHLSEVISMIVEPLAFESEGNEVDSTDDMIDKIQKLNVKLSAEKSLNGQKIVESDMTNEVETRELV